MTSCNRANPTDPRFQFTGILVAGDASDSVGEHLFPLGSGFFIAPYIALTARHVIDEISNQFHGCGIHEISGDMNFGIDFAIQHPEFGLMQWAVMGYGYTNSIDITALLVQPRHPLQLPKDFKWDLPTLSFKQVVSGEGVTALGYPKSAHRFGSTAGSKISINPYESDGHIMQVHALKRDSVMLPYPCYETSAHIEGGMSGGPVFDSNGQVCGVVSSSFELAGNNQIAVSYISSIWPCAGIELRETSHPITVSPTPYYLQALIDSGQVQATDRMTSVDQDGKVTILV